MSRPEPRENRDLALQLLLATYPPEEQRTWRGVRNLVRQILREIRRPGYESGDHAEWDARWLSETLAEVRAMQETGEESDLHFDERDHFSFTGGR